MNDLVLAIISLLVGSAVLIVGMNMMSGGLKKVTGKGLKRIIKSTQNLGVANIGMGTAVTALPIWFSFQSQRVERNQRASVRESCGIQLQVAAADAWH